MKDYTLVANNKNKTKITFEYDHGLPYKPNIRPEMEYGDWVGHTNKMLIKVLLDEDELNLFENKENIMALKFYEISDEYWIDLEDVYLIIRKDNYLDKKIKEHNVMMVFLHNDKIINGFSFND